MKGVFQEQYNELCERAEIWALKEIQKICKRNKWSFKTVYGCTVMRGGINGEEIYDTKIHELVFWYEESFGNFGIYVNDKGEWIEGQTPLVRFSKPNLKRA